jgi:hypothetical protein
MTTRSAFSRIGGCEAFLRRSILPTRLFTRGEQFRAPLRSFRSATPKSKVPRLSSSWLARRYPFGLCGFEMRTQTRPAD